MELRGSGPAGRGADSPGAGHDAGTFAPGERLHRPGHQGLIDIYEIERRRWDDRRGAARAEQIRLVLDSDNLRRSRRAQLPGIPVGGWHRAAVAWLASEAGGGRALRAVARLLQEVSGRATPLTMRADEWTLWAWVTHPAPSGLDPELLRKRVAGAPTPVRPGNRLTS